MKAILESTLEDNARKIGGNPFDFLSQNIIPNGSFVSIGYINDHVINISPNTRYNITQVNDKALTKYIEEMKDSRFRNHLIAFQNSEKYQKALADGKTAPFNIEGDVHIIKFGRFVVNWKDTKAFAKFYADRGEAERAVRGKHGFGRPEEEYPEDDWRRKHRGVGINPTLKTANPNAGNKYTPIGSETGSGFYTYRTKNDPQDRIAIRQIYNPNASPKPIWLFVDADGNADFLDNGLMAWLTYAYKKQKPAEEVVEINDEEKAFIEDLEAIKNWDRVERTMLLDNILYMVGTSLDENKQKEKFLWLNDERIKELYPYLESTGMLNKIINMCIKQSKKDVNINESM